MRTARAPPGPRIWRSSTFATGSALPRVTGFASIWRRASAADIWPKSSDAPDAVIASSKAFVCGSSGIAKRLCLERRFERRYDLVDRLFALVQVVRHADEAVNRAVIARACHRHPSGAEFGRVCFALVAQ